MSYRTLEDLHAARDEIAASIEGFAPPAAYAVGIATVGASGDVLDVSYPAVNLGFGFPAAVLASTIGHVAGTMAHAITPEQLDAVITGLLPAEPVDVPHPNLASWRALRQLVDTPSLSGTRQLYATFIGDLDDDPTGPADAYLRLHLLSKRLVQPHGMSMNGVFGKLTNVVWTNLGPFDVEGFDQKRAELRAGGHEVSVHLVDKFPRMLDYVIPSGVRIADANRVRMGAHLAEGTTVMHEGFCNFNAGTLGASMVEGRISAGVVVGDGSDVGGGASIMGTLSGGGSQTISVGKNCLLGANSGLGISLGDDCIVEAGLYLTAGTRVAMPDGSVEKAVNLSGADGLLFRRNSTTGAVEAIARTEAASWQGLNEDLHKN